MLKFLFKLLINFLNKKKDIIQLFISSLKFFFILINRDQILLQLEKSHSGDLKKEAKAIADDSKMQLSFFQLDDPVLMKIKEEIEKIDINTLTPVEALMKLNEIKKYVGIK